MTRLTALAAAFAAGMTTCAYAQQAPGNFGEEFNKAGTGAAMSEAPGAPAKPVVSAGHDGRGMLHVKTVALDPVKTGSIDADKSAEAAAAQKPQKTAKAAKPEKPVKAAKAEKAEKPKKAERAAKADKAGKAEKAEKAARAADAAEAEKTALAVQEAMAEKAAYIALQTKPGKSRKPAVLVTSTDLIGGERKKDVLEEVTDTTTTASTGSAVKYQTIISRYAAAYGVPESLAHAVIRVESNYQVDARGAAGEVGLMQIKPATAEYMGYNGSVKALYNPETNIRYGMKYLSKAYKLGGGTTCGTILKYNAGHGAKKMNPVSAAYCSKVKKHLAES